MTDLYTDYAQEFSRTRQSPWHGWSRVLASFRTLQKEPSFLNRSLNILDLGCGNGRFAKFLIENEVACNYLGVDKSEPLLRIARGQNFELPYSTFSFLQADLTAETWDAHIAPTYDVVTAFGVMHHIAPFKARVNLMQKALEHLVPQGLFALNFWRFGVLERYTNKTVHTDLNHGTKYFENDFILKFNGKAERFCHFVSTQELHELEKLLAYDKVDDFVDDGRTGNENHYRIYHKL